MISVIRSHDSGLLVRSYYSVVGFGPQSPQTFHLCEPWCWKAGIPRFARTKSPSHVGKYTSTVEHLGIQSTTFFNYTKLFDHFRWFKTCLNPIKLYPEVCVPQFSHGEVEVQCWSRLRQGQHCLCALRLRVDLQGGNIFHSKLLHDQRVFQLVYPHEL